MAHIVAISSGPILRPQDGRPFTRGEVINENGVWAVMLPEFPEVFTAKTNVIDLIEREMMFHLHCPSSSLKKMDKVMVELRADSEREIIAPLADLLIPQKAVWILSGEAGRDTVGRLIEWGHRRSTIYHDSEDKRERRRNAGLPADLFFWVEGVMSSLSSRTVEGGVQTEPSRR